MIAVKPHELKLSQKQKAPILVTPIEFPRCTLIKLVPESVTVAWRMGCAETSVGPPLNSGRPSKLQTRIHSFDEEQKANNVWLVLILHPSVIG